MLITCLWLTVLLGKLLGTVGMGVGQELEKYLRGRTLAQCVQDPAFHPCPSPGKVEFKVSVYNGNWG